MRFRTDVKGAGHAIRQIEDAIKDGIAEGSAETGVEAEQVAKQRIRKVGAIFTGDLLNSFDIDIRKQGGNLVVRLTNDSDHAGPIEYGAEYTERGPPVVALIPWVRAKMTGFQIPEGDREDLPDPETVDADFEIPEPDGSITDLRNVVDSETLDRAFWLQQHIKEEGIDAVRYMERAERYVKENAADNVAEAISMELKT